MLDLVGAVSVGAVTIFSYMTLLYILSLVKRDTSIVDIGWGLGFVLIGIALTLALDENTGVFELVKILVILWGARLFTHIILRKAGKPEDWRYANWREQWGKTHWWRSYLQVFLLQGLLILLIASPLFISASNTNAELSLLSWLGAGVWVFGFYFETVGDYQLTKFLKRQATKKKLNKKGKKSKKQTKKAIMQTGLWKYTRHPNYFGEITQWWGLFIVVVSLGYGWLGVASPLTITFLLLKISGVTMLEKRFDGDKEFQKYKERTSALIPLPPRK